MSPVVKSFVYLAYQAIRAAWRNQELWSFVEGVVHQAETSAKSGERLTWVNETLDHWMGEWDSLAPGVREGLAVTATWLLNLGIEAMVARMKTTGAAA